MSKVHTLKESVDPDLIEPRRLTNDCYIVVRKDNTVDVVRSQKMVDVFDFYHDRDIPLRNIFMSGGRLNPRLQSPQI
jgi:hypothetical protein